MNLRSKQQGLGALGWLVVLALASFALTCLLKIGPLWLDYWQVKTALDEVVADEKLARLSRGELLNAIGKRLDVNRIEVIEPRDITFEETREGRIMDASYEQRVELVGNIDVVVKFDKLKYILPAR